MKLALPVHYLHEIVEKSGAPLLVTNCRTGIISYANPAAAELHGYPREEMIGMDGYKLTAEPKDSKTALEARIPHTPLRRHQKKDGTIFPVEIFRGFFDSAGETYVAVTLFDITDQLAISENLALQNQRWEIACEATSSGVWDRDLRTNEVYRSNRFYQILGYEPSEFPTSNWLSMSGLTHPDDVERMKESRLLHLEGKSPVFDVEGRIRRKDGSYIWCTSRGKALRDANGVPYRMIGFLTDIHDLAMSREKLKFQNLALSMLYEISLAVIQHAEKDKILALCAKHISSLFGSSHFFLSTLDETGDSMVIRLSLGPLVRKNASFVRGQFSAGQAWESGEIQVRQNYQNWPGRMPDLEIAKASTAISVPLKAGSKVVGVFSLIFIDPREFSEEELHILQQFAAIATLVIQVTESDRKLDRLVSLSHRAAFLNLLVSGELMHREDINNRALAAGISLKGSYVAISVEPETVGPVKPADPSSVQSVWLPFLEVIQVELAPALVWERDAALNILYPVDRDCTDIKQYTLDAARRIRTLLQACLPELQCAIGIGNYYKDITEIPRSYKEAREALDTGRRLGGDGLYHYLDIGIVQMLARMGQQGPIQAFVNNTIGRLLDYDRNRKSQFLPTLEMILTGKSLRVISEEMNVHQKTIVFRKMRIEEILNLPLDEGEVRLNLSIALKLHKVQQSIEAEKQTEPFGKKPRKKRQRRAREE